MGWRKRWWWGKAVVGLDVNVGVRKEGVVVMVGGGGCVAGVGVGYRR